MERLIDPSEYTAEINSCIDLLKYRMEMTLITFSDNDIRVIENEGIIYILANPILGEEPILDECGQFEKMAPLYNLTLRFEDNWLTTEVVADHLKFMTKASRLRILRPELCMRINQDNSIDDGFIQAMGQARAREAREKAE